MSELSRDPKGYYTTLGVSGDADAAAIKAAFRMKAKRLHPDVNPSPIAAKQFQRLNDSYEILSDVAKRAAYDKTIKGRRTEQSKSKAKAKAKAKPNPKSEPHTTRETKPRQEQPSKHAKAKSHKSESAKPKSADNNSAPGNSVVKPEACQCGKVTAQPRYIIFDMVAGRGRSVVRKAVAGVFCRTCADRAALKATYITWIAGWWAFPDGPRETIKALWNNIRGGRKPADRNTRLLVRQAKAFRDRGDLTLARGTAEQALIYARTPDLRREVDTLLLSLSAHSAKHLKTRWDKPGWAPAVQLAPVIALVMWGSVTLTMSAPVSLTDWAGQTVNQVRQLLGPAPVQPGDTVTVRTDALNLRTGPGSDYQMIVVLTKGSKVSVIEMSPDGDWVRVVDVNGTSGFVPLRAIGAPPSRR